MECTYTEIKTCFLCDPFAFHLEGAKDTGPFPFERFKIALPLAQDDIGTSHAIEKFRGAPFQNSTWRINPALDNRT